MLSANCVWLISQPNWKTAVVSLVEEGAGGLTHVCYIDSLKITSGDLDRAKQNLLLGVHILIVFFMHISFVYIPTLRFTQMFKEMYGQNWDHALSGSARFTCSILMRKRSNELCLNNLMKNETQLQSWMTNWKWGLTKNGWYGVFFVGFVY